MSKSVSCRTKIITVKLYQYRYESITPGREFSIYLNGLLKKLFFKYGHFILGFLSKRVQIFLPLAGWPNPLVQKQKYKACFYGDGLSVQPSEKNYFWLDPSLNSQANENKKRDGLYAFNSRGEVSSAEMFSILVEQIEQISFDSTDLKLDSSLNFVLPRFYSSPNDKRITSDGEVNLFIKTVDRILNECAGDFININIWLHPGTPFDQKNKVKNQFFLVFHTIQIKFFDELIPEFALLKAVNEAEHWRFFIGSRGFLYFYKALVGTDSCEILFDEDLLLRYMSVGYGAARIRQQKDF